MRIAIVNLTSGGLSGGYRKYLRELLPVLERCADRLDVFVPPEISKEHLGSGTALQTWPAADARSGYRALRAALSKLAPEVIFFPTARRLSVGSIPTVVMVRNMEPLVTPFVGGVSLESVKNVARATVAWDACRRAARVLAVSTFVRDVLVHRFHIASAKIGVVPHGVEPPIVSAASPPRTLPQGLGEFLFTAGSVRPARGLEDAVHALAALATRGRASSLLVAGGVDPGMGAYRARIDRLARRCGVLGRLHWLGGITPAEMTWCLLHCRAFLMTSRVEACPNMVLEAMSHGCLSVSCDARPMAEFFGETALLYPTGDGARLAERIVSLDAFGPEGVERLRAAGRSRAASFTWAKAARSTLGELRIAAGRDAAEP